MSRSLPGVCSKAHSLCQGIVHFTVANDKELTCESFCNHRNFPFLDRYYRGYGLWIVDPEALDSRALSQLGHVETLRWDTFMKTFEDRINRLKKYEQKTSSTMLVLSLTYIVLYAIEVIPTGLNEVALNFILIFSNIIWVTFIIDLIIRTYLAPNRIQYLLKHPIDVLSVVLPAFRALRALRIITAGQWLLTRGSHLAVGRTATAIVIGAGLLAFVGALAMLDAERNDPAASITTFGDAIWWAFVTMSTVGYGDLYPITATGKVVAVMMMVVGVALLGLVSGTLVSALLDRIRGEEHDEIATLLNRIDGLEMKIDHLTTVLNIQSVNRKEIGLE